MNINNIRKVRRMLKISGVDVAKYLNISTVYYYHLEKGERKLSYDILKKLSKYFDVDVNTLGGGNIEEVDIPDSLKDVGVDAVNMVREAKKSGLSDNDIKEILEFAIKIRSNK